mgnify:CR=1 FL=1
MKRNAIAIWQGTGKEGKGTLSTESKILNETPYNFHSRFEDGKETNPEELLAAAHAGCFTMKLSFVLGEAGFTAEKLTTHCDISLEDGAIISSVLKVEATIPGISKEIFENCVTDAKTNCPVSKLLDTKITLDSELL